MADELTSRILYRLSLDPRARDLAAKLLGRFLNLVGDLPASAGHHHHEAGGLYQHSLDVGLKMLEEFEGNIIMERRADGSVDSFQSARNRPRWQYACFLAALCHDLGKLFDIEIRQGERVWFPLQQTYCDFIKAHRGQAPDIHWREDREHGAHATLSALLLHHLLTPEDFEYLGIQRIVHLAESLAETHARSQASPMAHIVSKLDQASADDAQVSLAHESDSKVSHFLQALTELIKSGELGVNFVGGQVYAMAERTAVVVPLAVNMARDYLRGEKIVLPPNTHLYNLLRSARLVEADRQGHSVRKVKIAGRGGSISLNALVFSTERIVPKDLFPTLPPIQFEIEHDPQPDHGSEHEVG
ncbi:MAG TPA: TraI domain-containing protein [Terriglobia bacterium]|nr:TraI domain-containing protein [Terriglobia bacterium]